MDCGTAPGDAPGHLSDRHPEVPPEPGAAGRRASGDRAGAPAMTAGHLGRERWVYGLHALAGLLLGLPTLGWIAD